MIAGCKKASMNTHKAGYEDATRDMFYETHLLASGIIFSMAAYTAACRSGCKLLM
jgi:hypothetical protein